MNYRHLTPSMSLLLAFEAAARHESYTRAAAELSLTQSAVSRQVQALEQQLGMSRRTLEKAFGIFLVAVCLRFLHLLLT